MTTGWLLRGKDGRLTAYAPTPGGVRRWTETLPGGPGWTGPELLPSPGLLPHLSLVQSDEGYVHLVGVRRRPRAEGPDETLVVHAVQFQTGRPLRDWQPLGTPHTKDLAAATRIGKPSAILDAQGSLHVFMRNGNGNFSYGSQSPTGRWQGWAGIPVTGTKLSGETSAAVSDDGLIDVVVVAGDLVTHWRRDKPNVKAKRVEDTPEPKARVAPGTGTAAQIGRAHV